MKSLNPILSDLPSASYQAKNISTWNGKEPSTQLRILYGHLERICNSYVLLENPYQDTAFSIILFMEIMAIGVMSSYIYFLHDLC